MSGLLSNIGFKHENNEYLGARNSKFSIFPGSAQHRKPPKWLMAASLMETSRLFAHTVARIEPEWIEKQAGHLLRRTYSEPHWQKRRATVAANEKTTLYGLVINPQRKVNYGPIDPVLSREIFIREALVEQQYHSKAPFFVHNHKLISDVETLEHKSRRQDILIDQQTLFDFYDDLLPPRVYSGKHFETWRKQAEQDNPELLFLTKEYLMKHGAEHVTDEKFPSQIDINGVIIKLEYQFEPGHKEDGVSATIPLAILNHLPVHIFEWLVPGLLQDKITHLIKSLPKSLRRNFVPAPDFAAACVSAMQKENRSLTSAIGEQLKRMTGIDIPGNSWQSAAIPDHLLMNFKVTDQQNKIIGMGRDLSALQAELQENASDSFSQITDWQLEQQGLTEWSFDSIPELVESSSNGVLVRGYPALVDEGQSVTLQVFDNSQQAETEMHYGLRRLFMLQIPQQVKYLQKNLTQIKSICLHYAPVGKCEDIKQDIINAVFDQAFLSEGAYIHTREEFHACMEYGRNKLIEIANQVCNLINDSLQSFHRIRKQLNGRIPASCLQASRDIRAQLDELVYPGFISETPLNWLEQYPRYMKAIEKRLEKLPQAPEKDRILAQQIAPLWQNYLDYLERHDAYTAELEEYRWLLEELRVSLFAQELKTVKPISVPELVKQWQALDRN